MGQCEPRTREQRMGHACIECGCPRAGAETPLEHGPEDASRTAILSSELECGLVSGHAGLLRRRARARTPSARGGRRDVLRREVAERFLEEVGGDDAELASYLRIEDRELEVGWAEPTSGESDGDATR
jgi:hypothetical protein